MDVRKVQKLIKLLEDSSSVSEIEITEGEESIRISRNQAASTPHPHYTQVITPHVQTNAFSESASVGQAIPTPITPTPATNEHTVTTPMVGTFYRAASPQDKPFIDIGQPVKIGSVLCIVEAMKMLNQIESDKAGIVKRIMVENGQPVEFGQPLFIISDE
ncbi:MAG TPA: acetyl-CoA carboxylase biotin carboxyl carrier protein [Gammaproteobacteria bacterium]|nr:acetyl-CoA carboxylase biotin carboxyl carrier protein [Gammaproteobacteria bacterium]